MPTEYIVMTSRERMPATCFAGNSYRRVAVCEVVPGVRPKQINKRARGMVQIVYDRRKLFAGVSNRCAYAKALAEAEQLAKQYNMEIHKC